MRKNCACAALFALVAFGGGCFDDTIVPARQPQPTASANLVFDPRQLARAIVLQAGWPQEGIENKAEPGFLPEIKAFQRQEILANIVHYSCQVQVGPGQYDVIGIHRVAFPGLRARGPLDRDRRAGPGLAADAPLDRPAPGARREGGHQLAGN